jgi:hypothetical protein
MTLGGANGDASPPIEAICRTKVAVIGLTGDEAGRKTVRSSGLAALSRFSFSLVDAPAEPSALVSVVP